MVKFQRHSLSMTRGEFLCCIEKAMMVCELIPQQRNKDAVRLCCTRGFWHSANVGRRHRFASGLAIGNSALGQRAKATCLSGLPQCDCPTLLGRQWFKSVSYATLAKHI